MQMKGYSIESRPCNNAYGECFEVWQHEGSNKSLVGVFTRRQWAEIWIVEKLSLAVTGGRRIS